MKMRRGLAVLLVLLCAGVFLGCSNRNRIEIQPLHAYFVEEMEPYAFTRTVYEYCDEEDAMVLVDTYRLYGDDRSYLEFSEDFKSMWIIFETGKTGRIDFVITSGSPRNGNIRGTASRIIHDPDGVDNGRLARYTFWSDKNRIYLRTVVSYRVGTEYGGVHRIITIQRNVTVAEFARFDPWLGGGG